MRTRGIPGLCVRLPQTFTWCYQYVRGHHSTAAFHDAVDGKNFHEIPGPRGPAQWPIIGPAFLFKPFTPHVPERPDLMFEDLFRKYGNIVRLRMPFGRAVLLSDPQDMLTVFHNEGKYPIRPAFDIVQTYIDCRQIKTLSTVNNQEWRHLRMRVQPQFLRSAATDAYIPDIGLVADDLVECARRLDVKSQQDFRDVIFLYVLECLSQFCFNRRVHAISKSGISENSEIADMVRQLIATVSNPPILPLYKLWKTKAYEAVETSMDYLIGLSRSEVKRAIQTARDNSDSNSVESPVCPHLIKSLMENSNLSDEEVAMAMSDFFFGGTDTTSRNLAMVLYHIARHPQQQEILYHEIKDTVGKGPVTKDTLKQVEFTKACVKESFRLAFPLVPGPCRFLPEDLLLSGYKVPEGTLVMLNNVAFLHDPAHVEDPLEFHPQRWLRGENRKINGAIPGIAFMPFGMGSRMCLGKQFAELMMYLCLIKLVQNFELRLTTDPSNINIKYQVFPTTDKPLVFKFIPRDVA